MAKDPTFAVVYAEEVRDHLRAIEAKYHSIIQAGIKSQLHHEPEVETRN